MGWKKFNTSTEGHSITSQPSRSLMSFCESGLTEDAAVGAIIGDCCCGLAMLIIPIPMGCGGGCCAWDMAAPMGRGLLDEGIDRRLSKAERSGLACRRRECHSHAITVILIPHLLWGCLEHPLLSRAHNGHARLLLSPRKGTPTPRRRRRLLLLGR